MQCIGMELHDYLYYIKHKALKELLLDFLKGTNVILPLRVWVAFFWKSKRSYFR